MANKHQQPSFKFQTNTANYDCKLQEMNIGQEKWEVSVVYNSTEVLTATFNLPAEWSRILVFQFLSNMELSEV